MTKSLLAILQGVAVAEPISDTFKGNKGWRTIVIINHSVLMIASTNHNPSAPRHRTQDGGPKLRHTRKFNRTACISKHTKHPANKTPNRNLRDAHVAKSLPTIKAKVRQKSPHVAIKKKACSATELRRFLSWVNGKLARSEIKRTKEKTIPAAAKASTTTPQTALRSHRL